MKPLTRIRAGQGLFRGPGWTALDTAAGRGYLPSVPTRPLRLAIINDYEVVVHGLVQILAPYADRVELLELAVDSPTEEPADIALFDTFAHARGLAQVLEESTARRLVAYSWNLQRRLIETMLDHGASGYLSKQLTSDALVEALERIHAGEVVVTYEDPVDEMDAAAVGAWPGQGEGLTEREAEIVALVAQGYSNHDIAGQLYLSINTVKSYIRSAYRKMDVTSRSRAVLWAIDHGFVPPEPKQVSLADNEVLHAVRGHARG
jgi:DNA-binding NarL/FixJ family response regulator